MMTDPDKVDILAFGAHPDDVECAAAGVILKHIGLGKKVAIVDLTAGELGSYGSVETRRIEASKAAELLGVSHREQLGLPDGAIENNDAARSLVIQAIRKFRPDIVLANALHDRHPDHAVAAKLVADASFLSGLRNKITLQDGTPQAPWRPAAVYHYVQDYFVEPDFVIDITEQMEQKMEAIKAFRSQFVEPSGEGARAILGLLEQIRHTNGIYGRPIQATFAEGFTVGRYLGVHNFYQLI